MGPMMCGINLAFFKKRRGEPIEFGDFVQRLRLLWSKCDRDTCFTWCRSSPIAIPAYFSFIVGMILSMAAQTASDEPNPGAMLGVFVMFGIFWLVILAIVVLHLGWLHLFLCSHRRSEASGFRRCEIELQSGDGKLLALARNGDSHGLVGYWRECYSVTLACFWCFRSVMQQSTAAYEQVFGLHNPDEEVSNLPPPPPVFE